MSVKRARQGVIYLPFLAGKRDEEMDMSRAHNTKGRVGKRGQEEVDDEQRKEEEEEYSQSGMTLSSLHDELSWTRYI
jgi:hypothetical protein